MDPVTAVAGAAGSAFDFLGGMIFSEQERAELDLGWGELDTREAEARAAVDVAEAQTRGQLFAGAFDAGTAKTYTFGAVAVAAVLAGAYLSRGAA